MPASSREQCYPRRLSPCMDSPLFVNIALICILQGNILIDDSGSPCIADFGLATVVGEPELQLGTTTAERTFNSRWRAPEVLGIHDDNCVPERHKVYPYPSFSSKSIISKWNSGRLENLPLTLNITFSCSGVEHLITFTSTCNVIASTGWPASCTDKAHTLTGLRARRWSSPITSINTSETSSSDEIIYCTGYLTSQVGYCWNATSSGTAHGEINR